MIKPMKQHLVKKGRKILFNESQTVEIEVQKALENR